MGAPPSRGPISFSCTKSSPARPAAATASRSPSSPACRPPCCTTRAGRWRRWQERPAVGQEAGGRLGELEERAGAGQLQVDLFAAPKEEPESKSASPVEAALAGINPDALSPR